MKTQIKENTPVECVDMTETKSSVSAKDRFGHTIHVGDWVYYASRSCGTALEIKMGKVYGISAKSGLVKVDTYKKTMDNYESKTIDAKEEMRKNPIKASIDPRCCAVI